MLGNSLFAADAHHGRKTSIPVLPANTDTSILSEDESGSVAGEGLQIFSTEWTSKPEAEIPIAPECTIPVCEYNKKLEVRYKPIIDFISGATVSCGFDPFFPIRTYFIGLDYSPASPSNLNPGFSLRL